VVRYYGDELAAVVGTSKQACLDALKLIEVEVEIQPFTVKEEDAMKESSPQIFPGSPNLSKASLDEKGDVDGAFKGAAVVVEGSFSAPVVLHQPLETHGNTISVTDEGVTAWASTQGISSVKDGLAGNLGVPQDKVRVLCDYMGGGFGSKFGPGVEGGLAGRLSKAAGAPVKLMLTRFEEALAVGNRPSTFQKLKLGADKDGQLVAFEAETCGSPGISGGGQSAGGGGGAAVRLPYLYEVANRRVKQASVVINAGAARAMRAPAHPQSSFGMESIMDELAVKLGIDPVELRIKNDPSEIRREQWKVGAEKFSWKEKYKKPGTSPGVVKMGVGCAGSTWGGGGKGTQAEVTVNPDGTVVVRCGTQDLGTGTRTLIAVVAAEGLGLKPEQINVQIGDTNFPPSGGSGGSTTAASVSPAIWDACENVVKELSQKSGLADVRGSNWTAACQKLGVDSLKITGKWREGLSASGANGVQFAEVAVDTETGFVKLKKILCVQDCGLIVNPLTTTSQVNGGIIASIGYGLYENRLMDRGTGVMLNPNFETYKIPNIADIPPIEVILMDMPERGVIGIGEPVTIPTASAIANAVANALGARVNSLPITPDKILAVLGRFPKAVTV
jgi:xanthine dehydrogenase YagR molybdenum-binding subunit